jgi:hypothetical protein
MTLKSVVWRNLGANSQWAHVCAPATEGELSGLGSGPLHLKQHDGMVIAVGAGPSPEASSAVACFALEAGADKNEAGARLHEMQVAVWRAFEAGWTDGQVPEILACVVGSRETVAWCSGPNGIAVEKGGLLTLAVRDMRYAELARRGVDLTRVRSALFATPLRDSAMGLSRIEPPQASVDSVRLDESEVVVLVSQGAMPFGPIQHPLPVATWWARERGMDHGMAGDVVVVSPTSCSDRAGLVLSEFVASRIEGKR